MRENRNAIYVTLVITTVSLGLAIVFEYNEKLNELLLRADFIINCLLGIFSGSILALITAVINYRVERKRIITELLNFTQCLTLELMPLNNLFFEGGNFDSQKQIEIIESACDMLRDYIHLRPIEFHPFFQRGRLVNANKKVMDMLIELYVKIEALRRLIIKCEFDIIDDEELNERIEDLLKYLKKYENSCYTNVLGERRDELQKLVGIKYDHEEKMEF